MAIAIVLDATRGLIDELPNDGGYALELSGVTAGTYNIHVGPAGSANDPFCYSGVSGQGQVITVGDDGIASLSIPILEIGGPYAFFLARLSGDAAPTTTSDPLLTIVAHTYANRTFGIRRL